MKKWLLGVTLALVFGGCSTLEVQVGYDKDYDFKMHNDFTVVYVKKDDKRNMARSLIKKALTKYIEAKGYKNVSKDEADFYFTIHTDIKTKSEVVENYEKIGVRPSYNDRLYSTPLLDSTYAYDNRYNDRDMRVTTSTYEYKEGKLIIEVFDAKTKEIIWQGLAKDEISPNYTQKEADKYIAKVIDELFKDFPAK